MAPHPKKNGSKKNHAYQSSLHGCKTTIETIANCIGQEKVYFNGESPIVFGAVKPAIRRAFEAENVFDHIDYDGDAPLDIDAIVENEFDMIEPTELRVVGIPTAAAIGRATTNRQVAINNLNNLDAGVDINLGLETYRIEQAFRAELTAAENNRPNLNKALFDQRRYYREEKEKFQKKRTMVMEVFIRVFGVTTLSTVNHYLNQYRFRAAWKHICDTNTAAASGQTNAGILMDELKNLHYNARTTTFAALESNLNLLYGCLVEHGKPEPTPESRLYNLIEALKSSPGKEFEREIEHVTMGNKSYEEARQMFVRKAASIANAATLTTVHVTNAKMAANDAALHVTVAVKRCSTCKRTGHLNKDCWSNKKCSGCGEKGHIQRFCPAADDAAENKKRGSSQSSAKEANNKLGNRFVSNTKKNVDYLEPFDFITNGLIVLEQPPIDHRVGSESSKFIYLLLIKGETNSLYRIILDSGATAHMLPRCMLIRGYCRSNGIVHLGDENSTLSIVGKGNTIVPEINNVLEVQNLNVGILAVCKFDAMQFTTVFADSKGIVRDMNGRIIITATLTEDGIYEVDKQYVEILMGNKERSFMLEEVPYTHPSVEELTETEHVNITNLKPQERVDTPLVGMVECCNTKYSEGDREPEILQSEAILESELSLESITSKPECCDENHIENHSLDQARRGKSSNSIGTNPHHAIQPTKSVLNTMSTNYGLNPLETLHRQWGHLGPDNIKYALKHGLVKGCKYTYSDVKDCELRVCNECLQGRMKAKSESPTTDHKWEPLEKIAIDYKGDFARKAIGGFKGFMLLVDYATNYVTAELVHGKHEHTKALKNHMCNVVMRYNRIWRVLQSDSESIFKSARVAQWLRKEKIRLQLSTPYQHWQNGQVEVYVGIVMDKARTIMCAYFVPIKFWGYAILYVCYTMNRTPNSNTHTTSYEALTREVPDISNMVPFYAPGVYHLTQEERKGPWAPKAKPCRMLGYADGYQRAYYILNIETGRVIVRENCTFDISIDADDIDEIEVDITDNRDDVTEFDIMVDDDSEGSYESDEENDVIDNSAEMDVESDDNSLLEDEDEHSLFGGEEDWHMTSHKDYVYHMWHNEIILAIRHDVIALPPNPKSVNEALNGPHNDLWEKAISKELDQFRIRETFGDAPQCGQGMKTKLILYYKYDGEYNLVCKARLVVCGYSQRKGIDYFDTYSPTTTTPTVFMLLCIAGITNCHVASFDVSAAFLEGRSDTEMYAWLPSEIDKDGISRRIEILGNWYGSKQAGKIWNDLFHKIVIQMGFTQSIDNPCLYIWNDGTDYIYVTVHVDDGLLLCSNRALAQEFMQGLLKFVRKAVMYDDVKLYLAMDIMRAIDGSMFIVSQSRYIKEACEGFDRTYKTPMATSTNLRIAEPNDENESLLPDTGKLRYVADRTRPDILVALGEVSTGGAESPSDEHIMVMNRMKCYLNTTIHETLDLGGSDPIELFGYCDAAYVTVGNCKSRLGSCVFLNRSSGAISCVSRNDNTVSHSSTEAEIKAIDMICREIVYFRSILSFLGYTQVNPTKVYVDNKSAIELCRTLKVRHNVRHINVRINYIRELINSRVIELVFVPTKFNVADVLTKALCIQVHNQHVQVLLHGHHDYDESFLMAITTYEYYIDLINNEETTEQMFEVLTL